MTAQTPTSAVEALREMLELRDASQAGRLTDKHELEIVRDARAALAASQEAPKAGDVEPLIRFRHGDPRTGKPTPPASQGDAAPAGDAVRELVVEAIEDVGRGADVYIASKIVAKKIIEAIAAAPAPAVEREACQECEGYEAQGVFCAACGTDWSEQGRVCKACKNTPRTDSDFCTPCEDAGMTEVAPPAEAREPAPAVLEAVAWLHTIQQGGGEHDQALSFAPDNFPLGDELGFRSLGAVPLFTQPPSDAEPFGWYLAEDWLGWKKGYTFRACPTGGATTTAPFIPLYVAPTEAAAVGLEMAAWSERLSGPHDNRTVRRLLLDWAKRLTTAQPQATPPTPAADGNGGAVDAEAMVMMPEPLWDELDAKAREWKARALQVEAALAARTKEST